MLVDGLGEFVEITLVSSVIRPAFPAEQFTECRVITYHIKMSKTTCTAPYACKQTQYKLERFIAPVGTLNREAALLQMLIETTFLEHLEKQRQPAKRGYLLIYKLYVTITHQILSLFVVVKLRNNYESERWKSIFLMAVIRNKGKNPF